MKNTYQNPVFPFECADPYASSFNGSFWIYRTGHWQDGRVFGILRSSDLVHWEPAGSAMDPLPDNPIHYWAPEVHYENGVFYLYYSTGSEVNMQMRVATSQRPDGPFIDSGHRLTREPFAIDGHVFVDSDGQRYFFYATDFYERDRVGTGTVMDRMIDPFTLEGSPSPVTLANYDWQIYDPCRAEKNNLRWHTIEGSFALKRKGRYYHMFSGGNYQNKSYGVGYAVSNDIRDRSEWTQHIDGMEIFPILRTVDGEVSGPGHNSVVAGPDHRQLFCVYHVIKPQRSFERVLSIDRLEWVGDRMVVLGPTYTPRPAPIMAQSLTQIVPEDLGSWQVESSKITQPEPQDASLAFPVEQPAFLFHGWVRLLPASSPNGRVGLALVGPQGEVLRFSLDPHARLEVIQTGGASKTLPLSEQFNARALHLWRIDVNYREVSITIGEPGCTWKGMLPAPVTQLVLLTEQAAAEFSAPDLTYGWQDEFADERQPLEISGWTQQGGVWQIRENLLFAQSSENESTRLLKPIPMQDYEWVVNFHLETGSRLRLFPAIEPGALESSSPFALQVFNLNNAWVLQAGSSQPVPLDFDAQVFQQLRIRKQAGQIQVSCLDDELGSWPVPAGETITALGLDAGSSATFDMVRLTRL